jgi:hypothetical protein
MALMQQAKRLLDPANLLNPGVLVDPAPFDSDLRLAVPTHPVRTTLRLTHDAGSFQDAVHRCTGVGKCIADNTGAGGVMCPSYLATREEKDSTRGRAHVLQDVVNGTLTFDDPAVDEALDLCLSCKGCARDLPDPASTWRPTSRRRSRRSTAARSARAPTTRSDSFRGGPDDPRRAGQRDAAQQDRRPHRQGGGRGRPAPEPAAVLGDAAARIRDDAGNT